jgi:excisionase family DNA binding protein
MSDRRALYVRLPADAAAKLDRAVYELKTSKQDLIAGLVAGLDIEAAPQRVALELEDEGLTVGRHEFRPAGAPDVLTAAEVADLLRTTEDAVLELARSGELPGRRLGGEWRFARAAVLEWLGRAGAAPA